MAYTNRQENREHAFKTIRKVIEAAAVSGAWPHCVLLCGSEEFLIRWAEGYIRDRVIEPASAALDLSVFEDAPSYEDVYAACETLPMMSRKKLVLVRGEHLFGAQAGESDAKLLADYLPELPDSTLLVMSCPKPNKLKALYKAVSKSGLIFDFAPLDNATLAGWMQKRMKDAGLSADTGDLMDFALDAGYGARDSSYGLYDLENDLRKVIALSEGGRVTREALKAAAPRRAESDAFALIDSMFSGQRSRAYEILANNISAEMPSQQTSVVLRFTGLIISQLEIMLEGSERKAEGQSLQRIAAEMGGSEYRLKKALAAASGRSLPRLRRDLFNALQIEKDIKSGAMDPRMAIELFMAGLWEAR